MSQFRPADPYQSCVILGTAQSRIAPEKSEVERKGERAEETAEKHGLGLAFISSVLTELRK